ncbi:MAG TPA: diiron oxygenase [Acidimicrobiales bacterium]|nr:diiron oxygenase [Acidimicrobiales bacterium]
MNRLTKAAARRVVEPDDEVPGAPGEGQLLADELLSIAGLDLELSPEQRAKLAREEVASITAAGIRFEAVLEAGFGVQLATAEDLTDPRLTFILHEIGEETRHQRLFQRLLAELRPTARSPIPTRVVRLGYRLAIELTASNPALFYVLVLAGEEIPDLIQKLASEHPETDPFIRAVNRYHRMEEARHLSFARAVFPEVLASSRRLERVLVRHVAPRLISVMFHDLVHPGVYASVGLPAFSTWRRANATSTRRQLRYDATRPVLEVLLDAGAVRRGRVPAPWRRLCGVAADGTAADLAPATA